MSPGQGLGAPRENRNLFRLGDVAGRGIVHQGAVPVEEDRGTHQDWKVSAARTAAATPGSESSGRVRGSSRTFPPSMRATTEGDPSRSRRARLAAPPGPGSRATRVVGSSAPGNEPPPTAEEPGARALAP